MVNPIGAKYVHLMHEGVNPMTSSMEGRSWGLTPEEGTEAFGLVATSFARCLPRLGPRSQVEPMLTNLMERSPIFQAFSVEQCAHVWERCRIILDAVYLEFEESPDDS